MGASGSVPGAGVSDGAVVVVTDGSTVVDVLLEVLDVLLDVVDDPPESGPVVLVVPIGRSGMPAEGAARTSTNAKPAAAAEARASAARR